MNKNRIEGVAEQGERANGREALVTKVRCRRCGGAVEECVLTWRDWPAKPRYRQGTEAKRAHNQELLVSYFREAWRILTRRAGSVSCQQRQERADR